MENLRILVWNYTFSSYFIVTLNINPTENETF